MQLILQRVTSASVAVGSEVVGRIGFGLLVFVAVEIDDTSSLVAAAARKLGSLRVFDDSKGQMNLDAHQAGAAFLIVSQFTLAASLGRGRRPSFERAAEPTVARRHIDALAAHLASDGFHVERGRFGARMDVSLVNHGPVTFHLALP